MFVLFSDRKARNAMTRRALLVGGVQAAFVCAVGGRLAYLQTKEAETYLNMAESNRIDFRLIAPQRGNIFDRNGIVLAENERRYLITIVPEQANDLRHVLRRLARIIPITEEEFQEHLKRLRERPAFASVPIAENVSWEQVSAVSVNAPALPGVYADHGSARVYPLGEDFAHVVGYVGRVSQTDLDNPNDRDPLLRLPRFELGKTGIERTLEHQLRGKGGTRKIEVNAFGRVIRELDHVEPQRGQDIQLSLDSKLQSFVNARVGEEAASVVVMDVRTGEVLAMTSTPTFDPNKFVQGWSHAEFRTLVDNVKAPLFNRCWQGLYPPGSTMKPIMALAALGQGRIDSTETVTCEGSIERFGSTFHCWKRTGHGNVDMAKALTESCDVYFYKLAERVDLSQVVETSHRFGLGVPPRLPLPNAVSGIIPSEQWIQGNVERSWSLGDLLNTAIGQGYVLVSAMQLAIMTARIATGRNVVPRLVNSLGGDPVPAFEFPPLPDAQEHLGRIRAALDDAVNSRQGTAYKSRCIDPTCMLAGKTGTSQVRTISMRERKRGVILNEDLPWNRRDHALFCGYMPIQDPRYAVSVIIEHGGGGSAVAAPIARDTLLRTHFGRQPPLSVYPHGQRQQILEQFQALSEPGSQPADQTNPDT
ncbi:MAG: penicillin-binding protein 2 [Rhodobacteraceae bacterium]|nr:penicillin-binding protein 2 [Paracoccaceae bacterium]